MSDSSFVKSEYPPRTFSDKYEKFLAPNGLLISPEQVFTNKKLAKGAEELIRKAFQITIRKLESSRDVCFACGTTEGNFEICPQCSVSRYCGPECRENSEEVHALICRDLLNESIDQVVECLPSPVAMGRDILKGRGGQVQDWQDWFTVHTSLENCVTSAASVVSLWWPLTGRPRVGNQIIMASLKRIVSNTFSTVLTMAHAPFWFPKLTLPQGEIHMHVIGAADPEVAAVQTGVVQICSRVLQRSIRVTLVAPDLLEHPQTRHWLPEDPVKVPRPDVALAIHPGLHTAEMLPLWAPTLQLLQDNEIPVFITTYNEGELGETLKVLDEIGIAVGKHGPNPFGSLLVKQTPFESKRVWTSNSFGIAIST